ncbi:MAG TPA: phosphoribosylglycinamide formyltransferase [Bacteroidetes bacterium]|mgnify:CR=1 FL=1|nr:phosphoribosylglycinamide formyltransferase [Candidatus Limimorpha avicola]
MTNIAVFVSGNGTNLQRIADFFQNDDNVNIVCVVCNNPAAYAVQRAEKMNIPVIMVDKKTLNDESFVKLLQDKGVDFIVLAGFLLLIPASLVKAYPNKIVNIHPALLPKYGGKGFYGEHVHEAVVAAHEPVSGITIHYVNEKYDSGDIIFQAQVPLADDETPDSLAAKIHQLEYEHFPVIIKSLIE